jgi:hypothetical protein
MVFRNHCEEKIFSINGCLYPKRASVSKVSSTPNIPSAAAAELEWLAFGTGVRHLEQEVLEPEAVGQKNPFRPSLPSLRTKEYIVVYD